jgi:translation initiation factor 1 (eIF-1/SUI1)
MNIEIKIFSGTWIKSVKIITENSESGKKIQIIKSFNNMMCKVGKLAMPIVSALSRPEVY